MRPTPFRVDVPQPVLDDLRVRLERTRFAPDSENNRDDRYGLRTAYVRELVRHWLDAYDWRAEEAAMNAIPQFLVEIDGAPIHFFHIRGNGPSPLPLVLTHGWPWTSWDYHKVVGPLTDPAAHGGDAADAFDVVVPSLPGYGFSSPFWLEGNPVPRVADLWYTLMTEVLGYERFGAGGGDWGTYVTQELGHAYAGPVVGVHLSLANFLGTDPGRFTADDFAPDEAGWLEYLRTRLTTSVPHRPMNATAGQAYAHAMHDSPAGLLAWLADRRRDWSDNGGDVERVFTKDELITTAMIYWVTETFASSTRYYAERQFHPWVPRHDRHPMVEAPTGVAVFLRDVIVAPRKIAEQCSNLVRWTVMPSGGHFAPMEEPGLLVDDLRAHFRTLRP